MSSSRSINFTLTANVENLILQGGQRTCRDYGNGLANTIFGNTGSNLLDGGARRRHHGRRGR